MNEYFVYAIKSKKDGRIYVGMSVDPKRRIENHNNGQVTSTRYYTPWMLIYQKFIGKRIEARREEKRLKLEKNF